MRLLLPVNKKEFYMSISFFAFVIVARIVAIFMGFKINVWLGALLCLTCIFLIEDLTKNKVTILRIVISVTATMIILAIIASAAFN